MEINQKISMGEVGLIYYETILDKNIMSKIIISTILELHLKKYIKFEENKNKEIIIKIINSGKELKEYEKFILQCLKDSDVEKDGELKLEEITRNDNIIFSKNKNEIKDLIIKDAIKEKYIDENKLELKQKYFQDYRLKMVIAIFIIILTIVGFVNISFLKYLSKYAKAIIFLIELTITAITYMNSYKKFKQIDIYTEKAKKEKEKLKATKKYLEEYSLIENKKLLEIYLWEKYLAYATIFNINHDIIKTLKMNLTNDSINKKPKKIQLDFYENKYFYIDENNKKIYIEGKEGE